MMSKSSLRTVAPAMVKRKFLNGFRQSRFVGMLSVMLLLVFLLPESVFAQFSGGDGTKDNPYQISTAADLVNLSNQSQNNSFEGVYFQMTADVDMSNTTYNYVDIKVSVARKKQHVKRLTKHTDGKADWVRKDCDPIVLETTETSLEGSEYTNRVYYSDAFEEYSASDYVLVEEKQDYKTWDCWNGCGDYNQSGGDEYDDIYEKYTYSYTYYKNVSYSFLPIGTESYPFKGHFDGQGHAVKNLTINLPSQNNVGLFGVVDDSHNVDDYDDPVRTYVKNVGLENATIVGKDNVGGIVGCLKKAYYVKDCFIVNSNVKGENNVGGIVGRAQEYMYANSGKEGVGNGLSDASKRHLVLVQNCYVSVDEDKKETCLVECSNNYAGGLVGLGNQGCAIIACYTTTKVKSTTAQGAVGPVEGNTNPTGVAKYNSGDLFFVQEWYVQKEQNSPKQDGGNGNPDDLQSGNKTIKCDTDEELKDKVVTALPDVFKENPLDPDGDPVLKSQLGAISQSTGISQEDLENGTTFTTLYVSEWNLIGASGHVKVLNSNSGGTASDNNVYANDVTCAPYDYTAGEWEYLKVAKDDQLAEGNAYFVYVYPNKKYEYDDGAIKEESNLALTNPDSKDGHAVTYLKSTGTTQTTVKLNSLTKKSDEGYVYALAAGADSKIDLSVLKNKGYGEFVYTYNPVKTGGTNGWFKTEMDGGEIERNQGFVVLSSTNGEKTFTLKSSKKSAGVKAKKSGIERIQFAVKANGTASELLARQAEDASNGMDGLDSYAMVIDGAEEFVQPYFLVDNQHIFSTVFKSLPYEAEINFHAAKQSETEFSVSNVPQDMDVYIVDLAKQTETLLSDGSTFTFTAEEGDNEGRYKIKFINKKSGINDVTEADANVVSYDRNVSVSGTDLKSVKVVNMLGLQVYKANINSGTHRFDLEGAEAGTYVVVVETAKGTKSQKIIIK